MENIHETQSPNFSAEQQKPPGLLKGVLQYWSIVQGICTVIIAVAVFGLSFRDSQTVQAQDVRENKQQILALQLLVDSNKRDREKQLEELKGKVLTKDVFEAYHQNDVARMERIEKLCEQMLQSQNYNR